jgi:hypothetical protein
VQRPARCLEPLQRAAHVFAVRLGVPRQVLVPRGGKLDPPGVQSVAAMERFPLGRESLDEPPYGGVVFGDAVQLDQLPQALLGRLAVQPIGDSVGHGRLLSRGRQE